MCDGMGVDFWLLRMCVRLWVLPTVRITKCACKYKCRRGAERNMEVQIRTYIPRHLISTLTLIGYNRYICEWVWVYAWPCPCVRLSGCPPVHLSACARKLAAVSDPVRLQWHISSAKCIIRCLDLRHTCAWEGEMYGDRGSGWGGYMYNIYPPAMFW